jgi:hypothetical protein
MKERLLELINKILQNEKLKGFKLLNVEGLGNYKEVEYHVRFNLLSPNKKNFCVVTRYLDLDNFSDEELIGALTHEIAHFYSPPSSLKQRLFVLFSEVYLQRKQQEKIKGSRFLGKLKKREEELLQKIGGSEGIKEQLEEYKKEEDNTDARAVEWGFGKEIEAMRNRGETEIFYFRFIPLE